MLVVTYGMMCYDEKVKNLIHQAMYMDDFLTSADSVEKARWIVNNVDKQTLKFCLPLTKWFATNSLALSDIPKEKHLSAFKSLENAIINYSSRFKL